MSDETVLTYFDIGDIRLVPYGGALIRLTTKDVATLTYDFSTGEASLRVKTPTSSRAYKMIKEEE